MAKVSVIVPVYNMAQYVAQTLDSIEQQTFTDWECIIVDDGSTDNSSEIIKPYCQKDYRFRYFFQTNQGVAVARNNGIRNSSGKFILPLDSDDIISPEYIRLAIEHFIKHPETKLVYCKARYFGCKNVFWELPAYSFEKLLVNNIIFNAAIFKRNDFEKTNGYPTNVTFEDWDFWLTFLSEDSIVYQIPEELFFYRQRELSRNKIACETINEQKKLLYFRHVELYDKYFPNFSYYRYMGYDCSEIINSIPDATKSEILFFQNQIYLIDNVYTWKHALINKIAKLLGLGIVYNKKEWQ